MRSQAEFLKQVTLGRANTSILVSVTTNSLIIFGKRNVAKKMFTNENVTIY